LVGEGTVEDGLSQSGDLGMSGLGKRTGHEESGEEGSFHEEWISGVAAKGSSFERMFQGGIYFKGIKDYR
jgi:hypothetical protein